MAEAFLHALAGDRFEAQSGGIEPGKLNPIVVRAMQEIGIDISSREAKSVASLMTQSASFDYVITVCDETSAERCPIFPGDAKRLHWSFPDPSGFTGSEAGKLAHTRLLRDEIRERIAAWAKSA